MTDSTGTPTLPEAMSAMDTRTQSSRASLPIDYNKRLMLVSGRANPQLAIDIADKLGVDLSIAAIVAFGVRIFNNLGAIRRHYL